MSRHPYEVSTSISKEFLIIQSFWNIKRLFDTHAGYGYVKYLLKLAIAERKVMLFIKQEFNMIVCMKIYDGHLMSQNAMEDNCMIVYRAFKLS